MLILNPRTVRFGAAAWDGIASVAIDRQPQRLAEEWSDGGPYAVFADVPEQRTRITVVQELSQSDLATPRPGEQAVVSFCTAPAAGDTNRRRLSATAVVLEAKHELSLTRGALRTITLAAISADGAADPITVTDASDGAP
jgi:hypothetical protein